MSASIFAPVRIGNLESPNRFVRSATWEGLATDDGLATPALAEVLGALAKGGVGVVIPGHAYVEKRGQAGPRQLGMHDDACIPGLRMLADAVHAGGGRIVAQLAHAGGLAHTPATGEPGMTATPFEREGFLSMREMTEADLDAVVAALAAAARRAVQAGFDGVQVHGAHGYLLSQFLSPARNKRTDQFGGSLENRMRPLLMAVRAVREAVGPSFPVWVKLNSSDFMDGGFEVDEMLETARHAVSAGVDAVEMSGGTAMNPPNRMPARVTRIRKPEDEAWYREAARRFKAEVGAPLILVGGIRTPQVAQQLVDEGTADMLSLCRPLIREPGLVRRWAEGDDARAACISCNKCYGPLRENRGFYCPVARGEVAGE